MDRIIHKMKYYLDWYVSMDKYQRGTQTGTWVLERIMWFQDALKETISDRIETIQAENKEMQVTHLN